MVIAHRREKCQVELQVCVARFVGGAVGIATEMSGGADAGERLLSDPAAEQVYDELLARAWALRKALDGGRRGLSEEVRDLLVRRALEVVRCLRAGPDVEAVRAWLIGVLWPVTGPPPALDQWWRTPLGELLMTHVRGAAPHAA